jgi:hypothetical protein
MRIRDNTEHFSSGFLFHKNAFNVMPCIFSVQYTYLLNLRS